MPDFVLRGPGCDLNFLLLAWWGGKGGERTVSCTEKARDFGWSGHL